MAKKNSLKKALLMSGLSMVACGVMLAGTTFAWFSSTASTAENQIVAGNLQVDIQDKNDRSLANKTIFKDYLWEPGMMVVSDAFKIANTGSLELKYSVSIAMKDVDTVTVYNEDDEEEIHGLSEVIKFKVVAADTEALLTVDNDENAVDRATVWAELQEADIATGTLAPTAKTEALVAVLYWAPTEYDNLFNVEYGQLTTNFSVSVFATQAVKEKDSFGNQYDKDASAQSVIVDTVIAGVEKMNALMLTDEGEAYAEMSELTYNEETGVYESTITMDPDYASTVNVSKVFGDIGQVLFGEVIAKSDLIYSIAFTEKGYDIIPQGTVTNAGAEIQDFDLIVAIASGCLGHYTPEELGPGFGGKLPIYALSEKTLVVVITTMEGEAITFELPFVLGE